MSYEKAQVEQAVHWLKPEYESWLAGLGKAKDGFVKTLIDTMIKRLIIHADSEALHYRAKERLITPNIVEGLETLRYRVLRAWDIHAKGGTAGGVVEAFNYAGYEVSVAPCYSYDATRWAEFDIYVKAPTPEDLEPIWDDGKLWDDQHFWRKYPLPTLHLNLARILADSKDAASLPTGITYFPEFIFWDSGLEWDDGTLWAATPDTLEWEQF